MRAVRLQAVVGPDRCLSIEVPPEIPPGKVEVIVLAPDAMHVEKAQTLSELFAKLDRMPHKRLTAEEVDRYLAAERASWE